MPCLRYMRNWIHAFVHDYERLKNLAKILIYIQIGCFVIGSMDVIYNYMSLINLGIALVGSSAIAMNNRSLTRTYTVLLFSTVALEISWFVYSWYHILSMSIERTTMFLFIILLKMETLGFYVRFLSTLVWIQMYRLEGTSGDEDQQHNPLLSKQELGNEVRRLEMSSDGHGMLLVSNSVCDSSNSSPRSVNSAQRLLLLSRLLNSFQHGPRWE